MPKRGILLLIILVFLFGAALFYVLQSDVGCIGSGNEYFMLPLSAKDIQKHTLSSTRSCTVWMTFQMNPTELDSFVSSTFIKTPLSKTLPQSIGGLNYLQEQTGWSVNTDVPYLAGEAQGEGEQHLDQQLIFIDTSSETQYVVYLVTKKNWL